MQLFRQALRRHRQAIAAVLLAISCQVIAGESRPTALPEAATLEQRIAAMADPDPIIRREAVEEGPVLVGNLWQLALADPDPYVRASVLSKLGLENNSGLGEIPAKDRLEGQILDALRQAALGDKMAANRVKAARVFSANSNNLIANPLWQLASTDPDLQVQWWATIDVALIAQKKLGLPEIDSRSDGSDLSERWQRLEPLERLATLRSQFETSIGVTNKYISIPIISLAASIHQIESRQRELISILRQAAVDKDTLIRRWAILGVIVVHAELKLPPELKDILQAALADPDPLVRFMACLGPVAVGAREAMLRDVATRGAVGLQRAVPLLQNRLPFAGYITETLAPNSLLQELAENADTETRFNAQFSLDSAPQAALEQWLKGPAYIGNHHAHAWSLRILGRSFPSAPATRKAIANSLASPDGEMRRTALNVMKEHFVGDPELLDITSTMARTDRSRLVRTAAIHAIAASVRPEAKALFRNLTDELPPSTSARLIESIAKSGTANAVPIMIDALKDPSPSVRRAAVAGLAQAGPDARSATPQLVPLLEDFEPSLRASAAGILGNLAHTPATSKLLAMLNDPVASIRQNSIAALARLGGKNYEAVYLNALHDSDSSVQDAALSALSEHATALSLGAWSDRLTHSDSKVRRMAIKGLSKIQHPESIRALESALGNAETAADAANGLVALGAKSSSHRILDAFLKQPQDEGLFDALAKTGDLGKHRIALLALANNPRQSAFPSFLPKLFLAFPNEVAAAIPLRCGDTRNRPGRMDLIGCVPGIFFHLSILRIASLQGGSAYVQTELARHSTPEARALEMERISQTVALMYADPARAEHWRAAWILTQLMQMPTADIPDRVMQAFNDLEAFAKTTVLNVLVMQGLSAHFRHLASTVLAGDSPRELRDRTLELWFLNVTADDAEPPEFLFKLAERGTRVRTVSGIVTYTPDMLIFFNAEMKPKPGISSDSGIRRLADFIAPKSTALEHFDPQRLPHQLKRARIDPRTAAPETAWLLAEYLKEKNAFSDALHWAQAGLARWTPDRPMGLKIMLLWQQAEILRKQERPEQALVILDEIENKLLPSMSSYDRAVIPIPPYSYTRLLRGIVLFDLHRLPECVAALFDAEQSLRIEIYLGDRMLPEHIKERLMAQIQSFRAGAQRDATGSDARAAHTYFEQRAGLTGTLLEREAEELVIETRLRMAVGDGQHEVAQRDVERLALRRQSQPDMSIASQSDARRKILAELSRMRSAIRDLSTAIERQWLPGQSAVETTDFGPRTRGSDQSDAKHFEELRQRRSQMQRRLKEYYVDLKRHHPEIASLIGAEPTEIKQVQSMLGENDALVQYWLFGDRGWVFVATGKKLEVIDLKVTNAEVAKAVRHFRLALQASIARNPGAADPLREDVAGRWLAEKIFAPVLPLISGATRLFIVPNGPLHSLPFGVIPLEQGYAAERFVIGQLPSASTMSLATREHDAPATLLAIGNATPVSSEWSPLPGAEDELGLAKAHLTRFKAEIHTRDDARSQHLRQVATEPGLIHLALHGEAGAVDRTRLVFSDGYFRLADVWGLALDRTALVVLSACESALGEQLPGDKVASLANGFMFAGARAVIASQWKIPDRATKALFDHFYRRLASGDSPSFALTNAQRNMIAAKYPPGAWAAFISTGR